MAEAAAQHPMAGQAAGPAVYRPSAPVLGLVYGGFLLLALVPVFSVGILPLADFPNHLARAHILNGLATNPDLQKFYGTEWRVLSFQSTDVLLPLLARAFGLFAAAKIYVVLTFLALVGGTAALHRALFGAVGFWPLASVLFLYNFLFAWGFASYLLATGLALMLLAAWISGEGRHGPLRLAGFAVASLVLLLCHFFAFAVYALLVGIHALAHLRRRERKLLGLVLAGLPLLIPTALVIATIDPKVETVSYFGSFGDWARAVVSPLIMYMDWADFALIYGVLAGLWFCVRRRLLGFSRAMRAPVLALLVVAVAMPVSLTSVWGANLRAPCFLAFLLLAASELRLGDRRQATVFVGAIAVLLLVRVVPLTITWQGTARDFAEFRAAAAEIERGSRVLVVPMPNDYASRRSPALFPYGHVAALAVIERDVFLPHLFTLATPLRFTADTRDLTENLRISRTGQPLRWQPGGAFAGTDPASVRQVEELGQASFWNDSFLSAVDWSRWPEDYDYLVDVHFGQPANPVPALLTAVAEGSFFTIYRIHPSGH